MSLEKQKQLGRRYRSEAEADINLGLQSGADPMREYLLALSKVSRSDAEADLNDCQPDASNASNENVDSVDDAANCFENEGPILMPQLEESAALL